jgi:peptidoglycan biosynthesis protein MviN/MurJ (putative lipid II flippase)
MFLPVFKQLLSKEMTRKEFLFHVGLLTLTLTGITGLLKTISNPHITTHQSQSKTGFGSRTYGA